MSCCPMMQQCVSNKNLLPITTRKVEIPAAVRTEADGSIHQANK